MKHVICSNHRGPKPAFCPVHCARNRFNFATELRTDRQGWQTRVQLSRYNSRTKRWQYIDGYGRHQSNTQYYGQWCLLKNKCYKFTVFDNGGNGFCCEHGEGFWKAYARSKLGTTYFVIGFQTLHNVNLSTAFSSPQLFLCAVHLPDDLKNKLLPPWTER